jgi:hypothetical protein
MECGHPWAVLLGVVSMERRHGLAYLNRTFERRVSGKNHLGLTAAQFTLATDVRVLVEQNQEPVAA